MPNVFHRRHPATRLSDVPFSTVATRAAATQILGQRTRRLPPPASRRNVNPQAVWLSSAPHLTAGIGAAATQQ